MNPGAPVVAEVLVNPDAKCYAHALNLCEVSYAFHRAPGRDEALNAVAGLGRLGVFRMLR